MTGHPAFMTITDITSVSRVDQRACDAILAGPTSPGVWAGPTPDRSSTRARKSVGNPGASAKAEWRRRRKQWRRQVRGRHPITGLLVYLLPEPRDIRVWRQGADGERAVGSFLASHTGRGVRLLHDRAVPGSKANVDHVAVTRSGVYVVDTKNHRGRPVTHRGGRGLSVSGRDETALARGMRWQVRTVEDAVRSSGVPMPVSGVLAFPSLGGTRSAGVVCDVPVLSPSGVTKLLRRRGGFSRGDVHRVAAHLAVVMDAA